MGNRLHDTRRVRRIPLDGSIRSEVNGCFEAAVLDLSDRGARIEHREVVRPGQVYVMELRLPGVSTLLRLSAYAVWSWVHRFQPGHDTGGIVFHSGVEFQGLAEGTRQALAEFLGQADTQAPEVLSHPIATVSAL
jgi:hypothetical protein